MELPEKYMHALVEISQEINSIQNLQILLERILEIAISQLEADRGFVLLHENNTLIPGASINFRESNMDSMDKISRSAVDKVVKDKKSVLIYDAENNNQFDMTQSIIVNKIRSIISAPLFLKGELIGVIYIDSEKPAIRLNNTSLQFLQAFANQAAIAIENARLFEELRSENKFLKSELHRIYSFDEIIGQSKAMQSVYQIMAKVLNNDSVVLISGETGTGKELVARSIHFNGLRKENPFVAVNCAAISENIIESELFGHKKGAFTGALRDKIGLIEEARRGTLFLDEIGEVPLNVQVKLLRFLQDHQITAVGDTKAKKIDVRVIAATNKDLLREVKEKRFREDLYYRLNIIALKIPPLRERKKDIPLLVDYFLRKYTKRIGKDIRGIDKEAMEDLIQNQWPGNVRELENTIERAVVLASGNIIQKADILIRQKNNDEKIEAGLKTDQVLKVLLEKTLAVNEGNKTKTAEMMGVSLRWIHYKMKEWDIQ